MAMLASCTGGDGSEPPAPSGPDDGPSAIGVPPPPPPIIVTSRRSGHGDAAVVGQPIPIAVAVTAAEPIVAMELFSDGELVDRHEFAQPRTDIDHLFEWAPRSSGLSVFDVRVIGASGAVADTTPLWVESVDDPLGLPPSTDPAGVPESSTSVPLNPDAVSLHDEECTAEISIEPDGRSKGYTVQAATVGSPRYVAIDLVPAGGGPVQVPLTDTPVVVRIDGYDDEGVLGSRRTVLEKVGDCGGGQWAGGPKLVDGVLTGVADVDLAYLYLSVDESTWTRVPAIPGEFVERGPTGYDFADLLDPLAEDGSVLVFEAWGWLDDSLVELGTGRYEPDGTKPFWPVTPFSVIPDSELVTVREIYVDGAYEVFSTEGALCPPGVAVVATGGCVEEPLRLRWSGIPVAAEAGLLQVSQMPFPKGSTVAVRGQLHAEMIAVDDLTVVDFHVDLRVGPGRGTTPPADSIVDAQLDFDHLDVMQIDLSDLGSGVGAGGVRRSSEPFSAAPLGPPSALYIRVVPFADGRPIGGASNRVKIGLDTEPLQVFAPGATQMDVAVRVDMPRLPNHQFAKCVRVIDNPFGSANPSPYGPSFQAVYDNDRDRARTWSFASTEARGLERGATVCAYIPTPPSKGVLDYISDVITFVGDAWDLYVDVWEMLQEKLVEGVVFVTGCEPKDVCTAVASTMLKVGLVALGVPPTMPNFSDLVDLAEGELVEVASKYILEESGLCPDGLTDACKEILDDALEWVLEQIVVQASAVAMAGATSGGYALFLNPDILVITEPAGVVNFGFAAVDITRPVDLAVPPTSVCAVKFEVFATAQVQWTQPNGTHRNEVVTASVIAPAYGSIDLATIEPGGTRSIGLLPTDFDRWTHLDGAWQAQLKSAYDSLEAWRKLLTQPGAELTARVDVCGQVFTETGVVPSAPPLPGDYPTPAGP